MVDAAFLAHLTRHRWYALESGRIRNPTWAIVQKLANALDVSTDEFRGVDC
jgi:transcriptional regulator with XRE-family HTH domain